MYVNSKRNAVFIAHPRTGSSAIGYVFRNSALGFVKVENHHSIDPKLCAGTVACVLRNPFDALVSWFHYHRKFEGNFQEFLYWFHENPNIWVQHGLLYGAPYANHILRYEYLQADMDEFMLKIGGTPFEIPLRNVSKTRDGRPWHEYYPGVTVPAFKICEPKQENVFPV